MAKEPQLFLPLNLLQLILRSKLDCLHKKHQYRYWRRDKQNQLLHRGLIQVIEFSKLPFLWDLELFSLILQHQWIEGCDPMGTSSDRIPSWYLPWCKDRHMEELDHSILLDECVSYCIVVEEGWSDGSWRWHSSPRFYKAYNMVKLSHIGTYDGISSGVVMVL